MSTARQRGEGPFATSPVVEGGRLAAPHIDCLFGDEITAARNWDAAAALARRPYSVDASNSHERIQ